MEGNLTMAGVWGTIEKEFGVREEARLSSRFDLRSKKTKVLVDFILGRRKKEEQGPRKEGDEGDRHG